MSRAIGRVKSARGSVRNAVVQTVEQLESRTLLTGPVKKVTKPAPKPAPKPVAKPVSKPVLVTPPKTTFATKKIAGVKDLLAGH